MNSRLARLGLAALCVAWISAAAAQTDPLPSWNEGPAKRAIVAFVTDIIRERSPGFVPEPEWSGSGLGCVKTLTCHPSVKFYVLKSQVGRIFPGADV
jgi:hypothetical protein